MKRLFFCTSLVLALVSTVACEKKAEPIPFDPGPAVIPFDGDGHFSGGWGTETSPYLIMAAKDLLELRDLIDSEEYANFTNKYYEQLGDIDFGGGTIRTISTELNQEFKGHYDGGGFEIRNAVFSRGYDRVALFGGCEGATIKRLSFNNCSVTQAGRGAAFVAGWAKNTLIEDCHVSGGSIVSKKTAAGSIVGEGKGVTIRNCTSNAAVTGSNSTVYSGAGGIVGYLDEESSTISGCEFSGTISVNREASTTIEASRVGGIVGSCAAAVIENCHFKGRASCVGSLVGGIVGNAEAPADNPGVIRSCTVTDATLTSGGWGCVGVIARNYGSNVIGCSVSGTGIHAGGNNAAGIVGINKYNLKIEDCTVTTTTIEAAETKAGGIIAEMGSAGASYHAYVTDCQVTRSTVKSKYYTGGIAGFIQQGNVVNRCFVSSTNVTSTNGGEAGGVVGKTTTDGIVIANCMYWDGHVTGVTNSSGIGGIVGSFFNTGSPVDGSTTGSTIIVNCMANPETVSNIHATTDNDNIGGIAGCMAYTRMASCYCPADGAKFTSAGSDAQNKRGSLYGHLTFGGQITHCYSLDGFKAGYEAPAGTYAKKIAAVRGTQMSQTDATSNVVPIPDEGTSKDNMTAALNECARLYNASSPLYSVTADEWVKTDAYPYPVLKKSPLAK